MSFSEHTLKLTSFFKDSFASFSNIRFWKAVCGSYRSALGLWPGVEKELLPQHGP